MNDQNQSQALYPPNKHRRRLLRWAGGFLAGLIMIFLMGAVFESVSEAANARAYPPPGQMVDVGGYRLHINCTGTGGPTVVIDAGWGGWSTEWGAVQSDVAKTTRVCIYDRAGTGWSEAGPLPRDAGQYVKELHTLLQITQVAGPFVMAGHSMGGLTMRLFAAQYPAEVAGVVLIDSMFPAQDRSSPPVAASQPAATTHALPLLPLIGRFGIVRVLLNLLDIVSSASPADRANSAITASPKSLQAWADEGRGIPGSMSQAGAVKSIDDIPLIVLTRGMDLDADWQAGQANLLHLSTHSQQLFAEQSGHNIQFDQPEAAVEAIVKMVQIVRQQ